MLTFEILLNFIYIPTTSIVYNNQSSTSLMEAVHMNRCASAFPKLEQCWE